MTSPARTSAPSVAGWPFSSSSVSSRPWIFGFTSTANGDSSSPVNSSVSEISRRSTNAVRTGTGPRPFCPPSFSGFGEQPVTPAASAAHAQTQTCLFMFFS